MTAAPILRAARAADIAAIERLLESSDLPTIGVREAIGGFSVAEAGGEIVGVVGIEPCGERYGLLRSAVVAPARRGQGLGRRLVERVIGDARSRGIEALYLLTTTAEAYFPSFGFNVTTRDRVPEIVRATGEFSDACPDTATVMTLLLQRRFRVLFLCTGNSARSQMAEAILNWKGAGRFEAQSAGRGPAPGESLALELLKDYSISWAGRGPRTVDGLEKEPWDFVITVCDRAKESCPIFPGQPIMAHWGMPDPAEVEGSDEAKRTAFRDAFLVLSRRIDLFTALPLEKLERLAAETKVRAIS